MNFAQLKTLNSKLVRRAVWFLSIGILILYPLRHVNLGVDLWDGGYNYANFRYNGLEYMDSMWYFATWLANLAGTVLMKLPFGNTMLGMNIYTGLIVSIMATVSYFFCAKKIRMAAPIAFVGGLVAETLCWAPTAALYNYLTYLFLLTGVCLMYQGLITDRSGYLVAAGAMLGINVGNRFSNLAQTGLIVAVWAYGIFDKKNIKNVLRQTGACVLGYLAAVCVFLLGISLRYGFTDYVAGIVRLFQMTESAADYAPGYMLFGIARAFAENEITYWAKRFLLLFGGAFLICLALPRRWEKLKKTLCVILTACVMIWLQRAGFSYPDHAAYETIYAPCVVLFEVLTIFCIFHVFDRRASREDRLIALLILLLVFITSLGGNNAMYSSINNTFFVAPAFFWLVWKFCGQKKQILTFPVKCVLFASIAFVLTASVGFGQAFVYEKATGGRNLTARISDIPVLSGMKTGEQNVENLTGLYSYLAADGLLESRCILYGNIPGVSYYMGLKPAMNVWSDLASYRSEIMLRDMESIHEKVVTGEDCPLVILERCFADYAETGQGPDPFHDSQAEEKLKILWDFMEELGYEMTYHNEGFAVYQAE